MRSDLFSPQNAEAQMQQPGMKLQNGKMLKVALNGEMMVRQGAMVAYQGNIAFQGLGASGVGQFVTGFREAQRPGPPLRDLEASSVRSGWQ